MKILITGMSGTGTSSVLASLSLQAWSVVDTDYGDWKIPGPDGEAIWDEVKMGRLLANTPTDRNLAIDGCVANQRRFYDRFDAVILLTAPIDVMLERVRNRTNNDYGKSPEEQLDIRQSTGRVVPLLQASADLEIDTSIAPVDEVVRQILLLAAQSQGEC